MYEKKRILAVIPARGGSKGIKNKNIIDLCGKPLIEYSIRAAKESVFIDDTIVSTDSEIIASIAKECGAEVPFLRPGYLAQDTSKTIDVIIHAISVLKRAGRGYDCLVLLQPTQPLRDSRDVDDAIRLFYAKGRKGLVSVTKVENHPLLIRSIDNGELVRLLGCNSTVRRQDMPDYYCVNGCIYINPIEGINPSLSFNDNVIPFIMDRNHSVDIDEMDDLEVAKMILEKAGEKNQR